MKKTIKLFAILAIALFAAVTVAYAYDSVQGQVIDSKTKAGWTHGGEVWVYVASGTHAGDICAVTKLSTAAGSEGAFSVDIDGTVDDTTWGGTLDDCTGYSSETIEILIDFTCGQDGGCNPPEGYPATLTEQFTQNALPVSYNAGYLETGTGPNAVVLQGFTVKSSSSNPWVLTVATVAALALVSGGVLVIRKRKA